jgi:hypothetical protein
MVRTDARRSDAGTALLASLASLVPAIGGTDVELRNYDDDRSYEFTLRVRDDDAVAFEREYSLDPGESSRERGVLDAGTYEVVVDGPEIDRDAADCHVGNGSARTVRVEAGNSVLSVSGGVS